MEYSFIDVEKLLNAVVKFGMFSSPENKALEIYSDMQQNGFLPTIMKVKDKYVVFDVRRPPAYLPDYYKEKCKEIASSSIDKY